MQKLFIYILFCFSIFHANAQEIELNKMISKLNTMTEDTAMVNQLNKLSFYISADQPEKAREYAEKALDLSNKLSYEPGKADAFHNIGLSYDILEEKARALEFYIRSLKIKENLKLVKSSANTTNNIALIYTKMQRYNEARSYLDKSLALREEINDNEGLSKSYNNYAIFFALQDSLAQSIQCL